MKILKIEEPASLNSKTSVEVIARAESFDFHRVQHNLIPKKFWQPESFDRLIRDANDLDQKIKYVLNNPVKAGLVKHWKDWLYSYCDKNFIEE